MRYDDPADYPHELPLTTSESHIIGTAIYEHKLKRLIYPNYETYAPKLILTSERLILHNNGFIHDSVESYNLSEITSMEYEERVFVDILSISGPSINESFMLHSGMAKEIWKLQP